MSDNTTEHTTEPWNPTAAEVEDIFHRALRAGDTKGIVAALTALAPRDPERALELFEAVKVGLKIAKENDAARAAGQTTPERPGRLVIIVGLPGSGKTTRARRYVAASPLTRARSNRDEMRATAFGDAIAAHGADGHRRHEDAITVAQHAQIRALLREGWEVVVDDTNLLASTVQSLVFIAWELGVRVDLWNLTYVPVETCIDNDAVRAAMGERYVGERVIREMHARWLRQRVATVRSALVDALQVMGERHEWMREHQVRRWDPTDPHPVVIENASQVLTDDTVRGMLEELVKHGRAARVIVELRDVTDSPRAADLGGSALLAEMVGAGLEQLRYQPVGVDVEPEETK